MIGHTWFPFTLPLMICKGAFCDVLYEAIDMFVPSVETRKNKWSK